MDIVVVTTGLREDLLRQTLNSLNTNATSKNNHPITLVIDGHRGEKIKYNYPVDCIITPSLIQGASRCRNIGAGSIPKYRRQSHIMFCDDDVWFAPGYDQALEEMAEALPRHLLSLYGHPYNQEEKREGFSMANFPLLISSVCPFMSWEAFEEIGFWLEPGGPAASEDFEFCSRAKKLGYGFAVSDPNYAIHTGITSSSGQKIVGWDLLEKKNKELEQCHRAKGRVIYG